eukprot:1159148-Pelagomonas_calceolata.AAC.15
MGQRQVGGVQASKHALKVDQPNLLEEIVATYTNSNTREDCSSEQRALQHMCHAYAGVTKLTVGNTAHLSNVRCGMCHMYTRNKVTREDCSSEQRALQHMCHMIRWRHQTHCGKHCSPEQ